MLNYLFHFLTGYVIIKIEGRGVENFLNLCNSENIHIRKLRRRGNEFATGEINPSFYHHIKLFSRDCGCKISVSKRCGMPFTFMRLKKRKAFCIGFFVSAFLLLFLCSRIWVINLNETDYEKRELLKTVLAENGVKSGMPRRELKPFDIQKNVLGTHSEYSWFWIEVKGTVADVQVRYKKQPPEVHDSYDICNIVSDKSGIIEKITVRSGVPAVEQGTAVTEGQLLVSGVVPNAVMSAMYVHSDADITAKVPKSITKTAPLNVTERIKTGVSEKKYSITLFGKPFNLFLKSPAFKHYDGNIYEKHFKLFGDFYLPVTFRTYVYNEVKPVQKRIEPITAEEELKNELYAELKNTVGEENIVSKEFAANRTDNEVTVTMKAECLEKIGKKTEITFENKPFVPKDISKSTITD